LNAALKLSDLASAPAGGRPLSNSLRFLLLTSSFGGGMLVGELLRIAVV